LQRMNAGEIPSPLRGRLDLARAAAAGHSLGGKVAVFSCALDSRWRACVNLDGGLDPGQRYPAAEQPVLALFGGPSPVKMPIETEEGFRKRRERNVTFLESASHRAQLAEYANVPGGTVAYAISPGFGHFSYYDLVTPEAEQWGGTPERARRNLSIIRRCLLAFLDSTVAGRRGDPVEALRRIEPPLILVPAKQVDAGRAPRNTDRSFGTS
jgi:pimeloyl-ACP methyl ester carboxylesterase